jgi:hypothetical protein
MRLLRSTPAAIFAVAIVCLFTPGASGAACAKQHYKPVWTGANGAKFISREFAEDDGYNLMYACSPRYGRAFLGRFGSTEDLFEVDWGLPQMNNQFAVYVRDMLDEGGEVDDLEIGRVNVATGKRDEQWPSTSEESWNQNILGVALAADGQIGCVLKEGSGRRSIRTAWLWRPEDDSPQAFARNLVMTPKYVDFVLADATRPIARPTVPAVGWPQGEG